MLGVMIQAPFPIGMSSDSDSNVHPQLVKPSAHWLCRHLYPGVSLVSHPRISTLASGQKQAKGVLCSDRKRRQEKREETELPVGTRAAQWGPVIGREARDGFGGWAVSGAWRPRGPRGPQ